MTLGDALLTVTFAVTSVLPPAIRILRLLFLELLSVREGEREENADEIGCFRAPQYLLCSLEGTTC